jgi:type VI secretion system protein ImpM
VVRAGVYGKLPARGDFVRAGLPRDFVEPWDAWWQRGIAASRDMAGDGWTASWLEAPIWYFVLPPGLLGAGGVTGVWMPSVDRAGRYFPLTIAAVAPFDWATHSAGLEAFLEGAEQAGLDALEHDLGAEDMLLRAEAALGAGGPAMSGDALVAGLACWWTQGGPRVAPRAASGARLPEGAAFAALLDDAWPLDAERMR